MSYAEAILEAFPTKEEVLTPKQFVALTERDKSNIKEVRIVAPRLGDRGFGGIKVIYKHATYKVG
jgi:hypothetical protein